LADVLGGKWTTVDRVLNAASLPTVLGIQIDLQTGGITFGNGDIAAGKELLKDILKIIAAPSFKFAEIEKDTDRDNFINKFAAASVKALPASPAAPPFAPATVMPPPTVTAPSAPPARARLTSTARATLAPRTGQRTFNVAGVRLAPLYRECREIKVSSSENAAAFLLRVFIELSSEALLVEKNVPLPSGKTSWADFGINLSTKVARVLDYLDSTGRSREFQQIRVARDSTNNATFSISTLHSYFHNLAMQPIGSAIQEAWDAWEIYLRKLHEAR